MWRLHRYYLREIAAGTGLTFLVLFGISILGFLPRLIHRTQGASIWLILLAALMFAMDSLPDLLLIALLVGTVFTFSRASADNEILAMRASGIHLACPLAAAVLSGLCCSILTAEMVHSWIPQVHYQKYQKISDLAIQFFTSLRAADGRIEYNDVVLLFEPGEQDESGALNNVRLFAKNGGVEYDGHAERISFWADREQESLVLNVRNFSGAWSDKGKRDFGRIENITVKKDLREVLGDRSRRGGGFKDMRSSHILCEVERQGTGVERGALYFVNQRHGKALAPLLMSLIAFAIGVITKRSGKMLAFALSFVPLAIYFGSSIVAYQVAAATGEPLVAWVPSGLLTLLALPLLYRVLRR